MANTNWRMEYGYNGMKDNPCKQNCPNRSADCRLFCERFKTYEEKRKILDAKREKQRTKAIDYISYKYDIVSQIRRRKNTR